jgi:small GTP-binding protein
MKSLRSEHKVKVILLGDGGVGKTSIANRYTQGTFSETYKPSLGVDFMVKRVNMGEERFKMLVFDTAGQEFISTLRKRYYSGADGAVIVFDVTRQETFEDLKKWVEEVRGEVGNIKTIFVGNKIDLTDDRIISTEQAQEFAKEQVGSYMESSALRDEGVTDIFVPFIEEIMEQIQNQ